MKKTFFKAVLIVVFGVVVFLAYNFSIGTFLVKDYVFSKLPFLNRFEIKSFTHSFNNFSIELIKDSNKIDIVGKIYPFSAVYEADFNNLSSISSFKGAAKASGNIEYLNDMLDIDGNIVTAGGYAHYKGEIDDERFVRFKGDGFDTRKLMYELKLDFPYICGKTALSGFITKSVINARINSKGKFCLPKTSFETNISANASIKSRKNYIVDLNVTSKAGNGRIRIKTGETTISSGNFKKLNLVYFKELLTYPFGVVDDVKFKYDSQADILNFSAKSLSGFYDGNLNIQLNRGDVGNLYYFLNLPKVISGTINSGNITIRLKKGGAFDIAIDNVKFMKNAFKDFVNKTSGINFDGVERLFLRGEFDSQKVSFNLLGKSGNFILNVKNGTYFYNGTIKFKAELSTKTAKYLYEVNGSKIRLLKKIYKENESSKTLVY